MRIDMTTSEPVPTGPDVTGEGDVRLGTPESTVSLVLRSRLYRGSTVASFLSGLGASAVAPQIASFLVRDLHASYTVAGLYYLTNLVGPVAGYLVRSRSDRTGSRLNLFRVCALVGFVGCC
jgi:SET family sugar efflux transporter-like MFS transporter